MTPREHSTEGQAAQALDGRVRKARRRADAVPEVDGWAVHLGRFDVYLWNAWKMVPVEPQDATYYLTQHPEAPITHHPKTRFILAGLEVLALRPSPSLADVRKELKIK